MEEEKSERTNACVWEGRERERWCKWVNLEKKKGKMKERGKNL